MFPRVKKTIVVLIAGIGITAGGVASASAMSDHEHHVNHVNHQARKARAAAEAASVHTTSNVSRSSSTHVTGNAAKNEIMQRESGGNPNAVNPSSGTMGAFQCHPAYHSCPALGDFAAQSAWADNYVAERYGSWDAALAFHNANGHY